MSCLVDTGGHTPTVPQREGVLWAPDGTAVGEEDQRRYGAQGLIWYKRRYACAWFVPINSVVTGLHAFIWQSYLCACVFDILIILY